MDWYDWFFKWLGVSDFSFEHFMQVTGLTQKDVDDIQNAFRWMANSIPGIGWYTQIQSNLDWMVDYFKNTGLDWSDMLYPGKVGGSSGIYSGLNFLSNNVLHLYDKQR